MLIRRAQLGDDNTPAFGSAYFIPTRGRCRSAVSLRHAASPMSIRRVDPPCRAVSIRRVESPM